jgi:pimeloyl-ACP methyl ester carboxylesterase
VSEDFEGERGSIDRGSGTALVFAHGMGLDWRLFEPQIDALSAEFRTVAYNLRAHSARGVDPYSLYDLVADFTAELDRRAIQRCILVGMSMGGYMAVRAALAVPERLHGIVLIGASAVPFPPQEVTVWQAEAQRWRHRATLGHEQGRADAEQNFSRTSSRPELIALWSQRIAQRSGAASYCEFLSWAFQDDVREAFSQQVKIPCLLIHGQEDSAVPLAHALETHRLMPAARLLILPYAGHAANLEYPNAVNEALRLFARQACASADVR